MLLKKLNFFWGFRFFLIPFLCGNGIKNLGTDSVQWYCLAYITQSVPEHTWEWQHRYVKGFKVLDPVLTEGCSRYKY